MSEVNSPGLDDRLREWRDEQPPRSRLAAGVERLLEALYTSGEDAEAAVQTALEQLRREPEETVVAITQLEARCDRHMYPRRWALTYAAARLEDEAALPFLRQTVLTPIPPEESPAPHSRSTVKEETVQRVTAVEGVGALAAAGSDRARASLLEFLDIESISIRRASVQSLLALDEGLRDQVTRRMPSRFRYLTEVRPVTISDVPQIRDPEVHLAPGHAEKQSPPDISSPPGNHDGPPRTRE